MLDKYGPQRTHTPDLQEHVGFANFDLQRNGFGPLRTGKDGQLYVEVEAPGRFLQGALDDIEALIKDHGFELLR